MDEDYNGDSCDLDEWMHNYCVSEANKEFNDMMNDFGAWDNID